MSTDALIRRLGATGLVVNGLWFGLLVPFHPNILTGSVAVDVLDDPLWRVTHTAMFLVGLSGVSVALALRDFSRVSVTQSPEHAKSQYGVGLLAVATVVTGVCTAATGAIEATAFPLLARHSPESLSFDGGLFTSPWFVAVTGPWLLYPLCLGAYGLLARSGAERNAAAALAATSVTFFVLGMWFVPIVGPLSCAAFGAVLVWWATIVWRATGEGDPSR